jgi:hypothetical protein
MTPYADQTRLERVAAVYGVALPDDQACAWLLEQSTRDLDRYLGASYVPADLDPEQADALADACALQAAFRVEQGPLQLGTDDGLAGFGDVSVSMRAVPRLSAEAVERVTGLGLYARSGTIPAPPVVVVDEPA